MYTLIFGRGLLSNSISNRGHDDVIIDDDILCIYVYIFDLLLGALNFMFFHFINANRHDI